MRDLDYYVSQPKADLHAHLNLSMRYERYFQWAGDRLDNFPRKLNGLDEMHEIIGAFTRPKSKTADDIKALFRMSLEDAIKDNVVRFEASVDMGFIKQFSEDLDSFLEFIDGLASEYKDRIDFLPELGIPKTFTPEFVEKWCEPMMKSGVFKSVDIYGPEIFDSLDDMVFVFRLAEKYGIKKKAHVGEFSSAQTVKQVVQMYDLDEVQHGIQAYKNKKILEFLAKKQIRCNVCPMSNYMLGAVKSLEKHPIKIMMDAGVPVSLGTDVLFFFDRSVSEQIFDLVSKNVITEDDADKLLAVR